ncbi:MAG: hypothetical protein KQA33_02780 [Candidatus Aenigmarchaeota archaeon]|nr:hypothetical protein [Candidatus Aenigmarchaeota archaeon]
MEKKAKIIIAVLTAIIIILAAFLIYSIYMGWFVAQQQYAYNYGYQMAILQVIQESRNCSLVPLVAGNQTFTLVDIECLRANTTG